MSCDHLTCEDRKFWTDHRAELAVYASIFLARDDLWVVISLRIDLLRILEDILGAEFNTNFAFLTALGDDKDLAAWNDYFFKINWHSCEDSH